MAGLLAVADGIAGRRCRRRVRLDPRCGGRGALLQTGNDHVAHPTAPVAALKDGTRTFEPDHGNPGMMEFEAGNPVNTLGINGPYLGQRCAHRRATHWRLPSPIGSASRRRSNWHGMHLPAAMDGGPHQTIADGGTWQPTWIVQPGGGHALLSSAHDGQHARSGHARRGGDIPPRRRQPRADPRCRTSTAWTTSHSSCRKYTVNNGHLGQGAEEVGRRRRQRRHPGEWCADSDVRYRPVHSCGCAC